MSRRQTPISRRMAAALPDPAAQAPFWFGGICLLLCLLLSAPAPAEEGFVRLDRPETAAAPALRPEPTAPLADQGSASTGTGQSRCRTGGAVAAGMAFGAVRGNREAVRLDYGRDDPALGRAMPTPCPDNGVAVSLSMSRQEASRQEPGRRSGP